MSEGGSDDTSSGKMRELRRKEAEEERLRQRQQAAARGRKYLREVEAELKAQGAQDAMTQEELAAAVAKIKLGNRTSHLDLRAVKQALQDEKNSISFLRSTGALQAVVGHLTGRRALHQLEAAYICCNLATGNEYPCEMVAISAGPYLVQYMDSQNTSLQVACLWTLGNLAGGSPKSFKILQSQGFVDRLTNCLKNPHQEVVDATIYALCLVLKSSTSSCPAFVLSLEEIQKLALYITQLDHQIENVDWLLYLLSCKPDCDNILIEAMVPEKCINFLEKLSHDAPIQINDLLQLRSTTAVLRTAANLCSEESGQAALTIITHLSFPMVLNDLLHTKHAHLCKESEWLARNLLNHSSKGIVLKAVSNKLDVILSSKDSSHVQIQCLLNTDM